MTIYCNIIYIICFIHSHTNHWNLTKMLNVSGCIFEQVQFPYSMPVVIFQLAILLHLYICVISGLLCFRYSSMNLQQRSRHLNHNHLSQLCTSSIISVVCMNVSPAMGWSSGHLCESSWLYAQDFT